MGKPEVLKELDENTATYMIEELKQELEELRRARERELEAKNKAKNKEKISLIFLRKICYNIFSK